MKICPLTFNIKSDGVTFKGLKTPKVDDLKVIKRIVNCGLDGLESGLVQAIEKKAPELLDDVNGLKFIKSESVGRKFINGCKSLVGMPIDIIDCAAKKFPNSGLNSAGFIQRHRAASILDEEAKALQGIHENALKFIKEVMPKNGKYPTGDCSSACHSICDPVTDKFNKLLNLTMADNKAVYDTKKERFAARLISGFTAAIFLGSDFYNKSIKQGKNPEEAKKEQFKKQGQEVRENVCEALTQFAVFACFSKFVNSKVWASALIGTGIGLISRVVSRVSSGMPIKRVDAPEERKKLSLSFPTIGEFMDGIKNNKTIKIEPKVEVVKDDKNKKKPILSFKNILLLCGISIAGGFGLKYLRHNSVIGKDIGKKIAEHSDKLNKKFVEEIWTDKAGLKKLANALVENGYMHLYKELMGVAYKIESETGKILIGTRYKKTKLFGKIEVNAKDLHRVKTAPFRFVKELVSYPYKMVNKLVEAVTKNGLSKDKTSKIYKVSEKVANTFGMLEKKPDVIQDAYNIKNIFLRFKEFEAKCAGDDDKLIKEFGEYVHKMRLASNNNITSSKNDNSKIAVIAQTLGTLTGIWFNMNDQFNSTVRNGGTKYEAEKDARERGLNKFLRMTVQVIISGGLNDLFARQYNNSIAKAGIIVGLSTILTDMASRFLSAMPIKKMSKEEIEKYQERHKAGFMSWYYKAIEKVIE